MSSGIHIHDLRGVTSGSKETSRPPRFGSPPDSLDRRVGQRMRELLAAAAPAHGWIKEFELKAARHAGAPHAIAVTSRNVALYLILRALDLQPHDEVILPAYAPLGIADVIRHFDAHPIPVDVVQDSLLIAPEHIPDVTSDRTRAIVGVSIAGRSAASEELISTAAALKLPLIIDSSTCPPGILPAVRSGTPVAQILAARTASPAGSPAGALITTFSDDLAIGIRRHNLQTAAEPHVSRLSLPAAGLRYVTGLSDADALWSLAALDFTVEAARRRTILAMSYSASLSAMPEIDEPPEGPPGQHGWTGYPLRLNLMRCPVSRNDVATSLRKMQVNATVQCVPINLHPQYQELYMFSPESFPVARNEFLREISLPIHADMSDEEVEFISGALQRALRAAVTANSD